ncbi:MAG: thymidylate synthase [Candidatus Kerfeldbacteria bacterium]|nr:thymidylate synthase [Candidatus Kerfeldbacteria bacterium]
MRQYLDLVSQVLDHGETRGDRTGVGTVSVFGAQARYDLRAGFPLLTTKKVSFKNVIVELLWFLRGDTNIQYLVQHDVKIWNEWAYQLYLEDQKLVDKLPRYSDAWKAEMLKFVEQVKTDDDFAKKYGELGPIYGKQWRRWLSASGEEIDQIQGVIDMIKHDPTSRRLIVSGWNVGEIQDLIKSHHHAPPSCHTIFQFYVSTDGWLDLQLYQRSADIALGVPYNLASYSALLSMVAQECDLRPRYFIHTFGDAHIYQNHIDGLREQLTRTPRPLPTLKIAKKPFADLQLEDFALENYDPYPAIKFQIAV